MFQRQSADTKYPFIASTRIYEYRNRLMHYTLNSTFEQLIKDVAEAMNEVAEFVESEIYWYALQKFEGKAVLIHIPTIKYADNAFIQKIKRAFSP